MLRREGHLIDSSLITAETFDRIEYANTTLAAQNGFRVGYALGNFSVSQKGYLFHGHGGGIDGYSSRYIYSRKADIGIAIVVNKLKNPTPMVEIILDHFLEEIDEAPVDRHVEPIPQGLEDEFSGFYVFRNPRNQLKAFIDNFARNVCLEFQGDKAYLKDMFGGIRDSLTYAGKHQFYRNIQPIPTFIVMETEEGQKAIGMKRDYAEKESFFSTMRQNIMVLFSAWAGYQTVRMKGEKTSFRVYHLITTVAILIVGIFLWQNGFLGLKLWSY